MKRIFFLFFLSTAVTPGFAADRLLQRLAASPAALAACGPQTEKLGHTIIPSPRVRSGPAPGKALVYFFTDADQAFGSPRVRLGVDGKWVGATLRTSFLAVDVDPGERHLCSSNQIRWVGTMVALNRLHAQAGKTYFFTTLMLNDWHGGTAYFLNRTDPAEAALLLQRARDQAPRNHAGPQRYSLIGHHPIQPQHPVYTAVQTAVKGSAHLSACGPSATRFSVTTNRAHQMPSKPSPGRALVYALLEPKSHTLFSPGGPVVNLGLDGSWIGALQHKSYLPITVTPGRHVVCFEHLSKSYGNFVQVRRFDAEPGQTYYFNNLILGASDMNGDAGPNAFVVSRVNPAEGALLVETSALSIPEKK